MSGIVHVPMNVPGTTHEWGTVADACQRLKLSRSQVHRLIRSGALESEQIPRAQGVTYRVCLRHIPDRPVSEKTSSSTEPAANVPETSRPEYLDIIQDQSTALIDLHEKLSAALTALANLREERGTYRERAAQQEARAERAEAELEAARRPWWRFWEA